jgi:hypothetical protein
MVKRKMKAAEKRKRDAPDGTPRFPGEKEPLSSYHHQIQNGDRMSPSTFS